MYWFFHLTLVQQNQTQNLCNYTPGWRNSIQQCCDIVYGPYASAVRRYSSKIQPLASFSMAEALVDNQVAAEVNMMVHGNVQVN